MLRVVFQHTELCLPQEKDEAVSRALTNSDFGGVEVYAHTDEGVIIDRINRRTRQTGQCPIEI